MMLGPPVLQHEERPEQHEITEITEKVKRPPRYKVIMHNDDYTTMEFVVHVLQVIFKKNIQEAQELMLRIHTEGSAICGFFTREIAETKIQQVEQMARAQKYPLTCSMEAE